MKFKKTIGWEVRLANFVHDRKANAFEWSTSNCATFCADAIVEMTGVDPAESFREELSKVTDTASAYKLLKKHGTETLEEFAEKHFKKLPVAFAQKGDILMYPPSGAFGMEGFALCMGIEAFVPGDIGLGSLQTLDAKAAYRIE